MTLESYLGTANRWCYVRDRGIVIRGALGGGDQGGHQPRIWLWGDEAKKMLGRTPGNIVAIRPMKSGVIGRF